MEISGIAVPAHKVIRTLPDWPDLRPEASTVWPDADLVCTGRTCLRFKQESPNFLLAVNLRVASDRPPPVLAG